MDSDEMEAGRLFHVVFVFMCYRKPVNQSPPRNCGMVEATAVGGEEAGFF